MQANAHRATVVEVACVALIALNMRPFLAGPGPVLGQIGRDVGLSAAWLSLLTLGPMALIGLGALAAPWIQRRTGFRPAIVMALALIVAGCAVRIVPSGGVLIASAAVCGIGVALLQAVMPALIRERFLRRYGLVTSIYSACLLAGGAVGAQVVPLVSDQSGWPVGLSAMALPAIAALVLVLLTRGMNMGADGGGGTSMWRVLAQKRTWHLIACFGALNASYATVITWIGPQFAERGVEPGHVGFLIAAMSVAQAISALVLPPIMSRKGDRRLALVFCIACQAAGFVCLTTGMAPALATVLILGVGLGGTFALMIVAILDCAGDRDTAVKLASAVQGVGFMLNAAAPLVAAVVLERTGGFSAVWALHLALLAVAVPLVLTMPHHPRRSPAAAAA